MLQTCVYSAMLERVHSLAPERSHVCPRAAPERIHLALGRPTETSGDGSG
jgi:hypothetical protein